MTPSWRPPAGGCSPTPNGDLPGRRVLGRVAGANGLGTGVPPIGRRCPGRCAETEPTGHGGVRPAHEQSSMGRRAGKRAADRCDDRPAEGLRRERDADPRPRPVAARRTHGPDFVGQARLAARWHRHRPREIGPQAAPARGSSCPLQSCGATGLQCASCSRCRDSRPDTAKVPGSSADRQCAGGGNPVVFPRREDNDAVGTAGMGDGLHGRQPGVQKGRVRRRNGSAEGFDPRRPPARAAGCTQSGTSPTATTVSAMRDWGFGRIQAVTLM